MVIDKKIPFQGTFPDYFLKEIEISNSEKPSTAPKALFLAAAYDFENTLFNDITAHFFILNIAKTHRVAIQIIQKINQIKTTIESAIKFDGTPQPIDLLVFSAHGDSTLMQLSEKEIYSLNDIKHSDFDGLSPDAEILLSSCQTGNSLAQKIADISRHIVFAPKDDFFFLRTSFTFCEKHGLYEMRSYETEHHPISFRFQEGKIPVLCDESSSTYFTDLHEFLIKKSNQGNVNALLNLGYIEHQAGNRDKAMKLFFKAAEQDSSEAQFNLGVIFQQEGKTDEAKKCYLKAAEQGHPKAQFNLGYIEEQADNKAAAKIWYRKAAEQGHPNAQLYLGIIEYKADKIATAKTWYRKAANQGNSQAQLNLGCIEAQAGNVDEAKIWYLQAAGQGNSNALFNLGCIEAQAGNLDEAKIWYLQAAVLGHSNALFNLGCIEAQAGNVNEAKIWYRKAAEQGNSDAQLKLKLIEDKEKVLKRKRKFPSN